MSDPSGSSHTAFDEIDTCSALHQLRSAKEDLQKGGRLQSRFLQEKLHRVETLLEEHAERNGFDL